MGPTASGKTAFALELAQSGNYGLISVDSALVYRGMDLGSAKPDRETLNRFPHRLIDIRDPEQTYNAAEFRQDAIDAIKEISSRGNIPLLVGGTGLYFRALQYGLSELPVADQDIRARLNGELETQGASFLHRALRQLDPVAANRIHPNDPQRLLRALEVIEVSGSPLSQQQIGHRQRLPYRILKLVAMPGNRSILHDRIAQRLQIMWQQGFLDEVRGLRKRSELNAESASMRAVGYRQAWQFLAGEIDHSSMLEKALFATRQLAKRQITWLRAERDSIYFDPQNAHQVTRIKQLVDDFI